MEITPDVIYARKPIQEDGKELTDNVELAEIRISQDETMDTSFENERLEIQTDETQMRRNSTESSIVKVKSDKEFYFYTEDDTTKIVITDNITKTESEISSPGSDTQIANRKQLKRVNNNYWKPLLAKRGEINEFMISLIHSGDVQLMKKAYIQFQIFDSIIPSPFSKDKRVLLNHESLLHICARHGDREVMLNLLKSKSPKFPLDIRSNKFEKGETILHAAVNQGNMNTSRAILDYPITENEEFLLSPRQTGLKLGILGKSFSKSISRSKEERIITDGKDLLNIVNGNNQAVIHICIQKCYYDLLQMFLDEGADTTIQDKYGHSGLHEAAIRNDTTVLNMIIQHLKDKGEDGDILLKDLLLTKNVKGESPIELACEIDSISILLSCVDEEDRNEQLGSLLALATEKNNIEIATFLVSKGARLDFENKSGMTPLKLASLRGYNELANYMLKEGGDPNHNQGTISNVAINNAAKSGHLGLIKILIKYNASLWDETIMEKSALHSAVNGGHSNLIRFLVHRNNMNPNIRDTQGKTPLYYAVEGGHRDCVKELLSCKANPELPVDENDQKAVHLAADNNNKNILKILLDFGALSDERNKIGKTPIDLALEKDYPNVLKLLLEHGVKLERNNYQLDTPMHTIAVFDSYKCANYLLRESKINLAFEQLNRRNVDKETPIDIAKRKGHDSVLLTYIETVHRDYFAENPILYHEFLEANQYSILKKIFDRMCTEKRYKRRTKMHCIAEMLDTNEKGQSPFSKNFSHLLPSLLHKLLDCGDKELREHPIVKKTVEKKLSFYRLWYTLTFSLYLIFIIVLSGALFLASYDCDSDLRIEDVTPNSSLRIFLEILVWAFAIVLTFSELVEFAYGWSRIFKAQRFERMNSGAQFFAIQDLDEYTEISLLKDRKNYFLQLLERGKKISYIIPLVDRLFCHFPNAFLHYLYNSPLDVLGIGSLFGYFFIRLDNPSASWIFASLAYIAFILSLLKYTRIIPSLGAYIDTVKAVFSKDIPRFLVLYIVILVAFIGGLHLAVRFAITSQSQSIKLTPQGLPDMSCSNDTSGMFYFNEDLTERYTIFKPLVTGIILLLDGGPGNREDDLFNINPYFTLIYLFFSFMIIVVLSNILIAQLSETYATLSTQGTFYYRMGLIVTMELESSLAFFLGKYFRQLSSIRTLKVPLEEWKTLLSKTPDQNVNNQLGTLEDRINKSMVILSEGNDKNLAVMEHLVILGEKLDDVQNKCEHIKVHFDPSASFETQDPKQATPKEMFAKVKIEKRIGMLESSVEEIRIQNSTMDNKLTQILQMLKK